MGPELSPPLPTLTVMMNMPRATLQKRQEDGESRARPVPAPPAGRLITSGFLSGTVGSRVVYGGANTLMCVASFYFPGAVMTKFRKKPVVIEAFQFHPAEQRGEVAAEVEAGIVQYTEDGTMLIHTLEGVMTAVQGDWIIRGVNGELYPCKPDIFEKTYEPVESEA